MLSSYFETDMKITILKVKLPDFVEEKYQSTGYFSVNNHWTSTLSMVQIKVYFVKEYFAMSK